jgi:hypothetical protein
MVAQGEIRGGRVKKGGDTMKKVIAAVMVGILVVSMTACTGTHEHKQKAADKVITQATKAGSLAAAEKVLADTKTRLAKDVKPEYFASAEWKAFVDAYWKGYNQGQEQMKNPEYKLESEIKY